MIRLKISLQCGILHQSVRAYHTSQAINKLWYRACFKQHKDITVIEGCNIQQDQRTTNKVADFLISEKSLKSKYHIYDNQYCDVT